MGKIRVGVIFGGKSAEHEVSLQSARNVMDALDKDKYEVVPIGIDKKGSWHLGNATDYILNAQDPKLIKLNESDNTVALVPGESFTELVSVDDTNVVQSVDVVFPVLHGTFGEDGTIQGLLKLADVPFVGPGVLGSAVAMDKDIAKRLFRDAGIPVADFKTFYRSDQIDFEDLESKLGFPVFVKPANLGSSVGVSKATNEEELKKGIESAFEFDNKIIVEEAIEGREIECSVLGNEEPRASIPGEIIPKHDFYSYDAKYIDEDGAGLEVPAKLSDEEIKDVQVLAVKAFKVLNCEGMSRVDMFLAPDGKLILNEINTIPGFTNISMYPKLWDVSGLPYEKLIDELIQLAIDRHERDKKLKTTHG